MDSSYVMTTWTAGNQTAGDSTTWDPYVGSRPSAEWLQYEDDNLYTNIRIFPCMIYFFIDASANTTKTVFQLYGLPDTTYGIASTVVCVIIKEWNY
jgi:hypothetical protein